MTPSRQLSKKSLLILAACSFVLLLAMHVVRKTAGVPVLYSLELLSAAVLLGSLLTLLTSRLRAGHEPGRLFSAAAAGGIAVAFCAVIGGMLLAKFRAFGMGMYDLGLLDQIVWNTSQGRFFEVTHLHAPYDNACSLGTHFELFSGLFALVYKFLPDARALLLGQTLLAGLSVAGCFLVAQEITKNARLSLWITLLWALFPALHFAGLFDVHGDVLSLPFVFFAYFFFLRRRPALFLVALCLALLCKEYVCVSLAGLGLAIGFSHRRWGIGGLTVLLCAVYFVFVYYVVMPPLRGAGDQDIVGIHYAAAGGDKGLHGMAAYFLRQPAELGRAVFTGSNGWQLFYLFFPVLFLPFFSRSFLLAALPVLAMNLLVGMDIGNHRLATSLPLIFIAAMHGFAKIQERGLLAIEPQQALRFTLWLCVSASMLACFAYGPTPLGHRFWREKGQYVQSERHAIKERILRRVPVGAAVSASNEAALRLTHRQYCYMFPRPLDWNNQSMIKNVDWIAIDTTEENSTAWDCKNFREQTFSVIKQCGFAVVDSADGIFLFKKR